MAKGKDNRKTPKTELIKVRLTKDEREKINRLSFKENKTITMLVKERFNLI
jgi:hypothetical protein